jgi:hypothetical protein
MTDEDSEDIPFMTKLVVMIIFAGYIGIIPAYFLNEFYFKKQVPSEQVLFYQAEKNLRQAENRIFFHSSQIAARNLQNAVENLAHAGNFLTYKPANSGNTSSQSEAVVYCTQYPMPLYAKDRIRQARVLVDRDANAKQLVQDLDSLLEDIPDIFILTRVNGNNLDSDPFQRQRNRIGAVIQGLESLAGRHNSQLPQDLVAKASKLREQYSEAEAKYFRVVAANR